MTKRILSKHAGFIAVGSGLVAASLYLLMITVTLAHIQAISGQVPFDMRPFGYGPIEAATLLEALGAKGRAYYLSYQITLDTLYPAMLALTLISTILWFGKRMSNRRPIHVGVALSIASTLFDYVENLGILVIIRSWPELSVSLVYVVSTATILKSLATTLAVVLVLLVGFGWARQCKSIRSLAVR
ncbi:hypothetical protein Z946_1830 [Sulfitobacter noctilucicola]|uniref:Uncharacterized protein n=1 Tax=Sulfitobacter noctilucicola TaxID=1342301 RepID=A0A7W6M6Q4_9RHOB|nr:hypothetical protein [Sulfitobacter noctilucicola]KIN62967.1 hypothetical protein Z946_1830 [Sulfitobacter noctilucicola]MBB4172506.1 hypothetical protein [Sulfitobacter noctilucicola]